MRALLLLLLASPATGAVLQVCPDGSADFPDLSAALAAAVSGDELVLCAGTFTGPENVDLVVGDRDLTIRGAGVDLTTLDCAWWEDTGWGFDELVAHPGISVGAATLRLADITIHGAGYTLTTDPDAGPVRGTGSSLILDRVRMTTFSGERVRRGGGVFLEGGSLVATDCEFRSLRASQRGGAVYADGAAVALRGCVLQGNGGDGGTLWLESGGEITNCTFERNRGPDNPGVVIRSRGGQTIITGSSFLDNFAQAISNSAHLVVQDCLFDGNIADFNPAIGNGGTALVRSSIFTRHWAAYGTSTINSGAGELVLEDCVVAGGHSGDFFGAAVSAYAGELTLRRCTLVGNEDEGAAVAVAGSAHATVENTIVAAGVGTAAVMCQDAGTVDVECSDFFGNELGDWTGCVAGLLGVAGNVSADPLFCDAAGGNYALMGNSPCAPANSGGCGQIGARGVGCGVTALAASTWGSIKALFR